MWPPTVPESGPTRGESAGAGAVRGTGGPRWSTPGRPRGLPPHRRRPALKGGPHPAEGRGRRSAHRPDLACRLDPGVPVPVRPALLPRRVPAVALALALGAAGCGSAEQAQRRTVEAELQSASTFLLDSRAVSLRIGLTDPTGTVRSALTSGEDPAAGGAGRRAARRQHVLHGRPDGRAHRPGPAGHGPPHAGGRGVRGGEPGDDRRGRRRPGGPAAPGGRRRLRERRPRPGGGHRGEGRRAGRR